MKSVFCDNIDLFCNEEEDEEEEKKKRKIIWPHIVSSQKVYETEKKEFWMKCKRKKKKLTENAIEILMRNCTSSF